jgi:hypothetical protein
VSGTESGKRTPRIPNGWESGGAPQGYFDKTRAATLLGKTVLIGLTFVDEGGKEEERFQMHGVIEEATPSVIKVSLRGTRAGHSWTMPPDLRGLSSAKPGRYRLSETDEVVESPDLMAVWTIARPPKEPPPAS